MNNKYIGLKVWSAPKFRTVFWAYQGGLYYFIPILLILTLLMLPHFYEVEFQPSRPLSTAILSALGVLLLSYLDSKKRSESIQKFQTYLTKFEGILNFFLALLLIILIISLFFVFSTLIDYWVEGNFLYSFLSLFSISIENWADIHVFWAKLFSILAILVVSILLLFLISFVINFNEITHHYFTRDRIIDAFLKTEFSQKSKEDLEMIKIARDHGKEKLLCINPPGSSTPYHIVVTAINLPGSWYLRYKDRKSEQFIFSKYWCGSDITGYLPTGIYREGLTKYSRTIALSGAALSPGIGYRTFFAQAFAFTLLNVRLGLWMDNPFFYRTNNRNSYLKGWKGPMHHERKVFWSKYLCFESLAIINEREKLVNITDGGHTGDNGGLYQLFKRRCRVIIAGDASLDPEYKGEQLFKVLNQVKTDEGIQVDIDIQNLKPQGGDESKGVKGFSTNHYAIGKIHYPKKGKEPEFTGWLIYFKPAVCENDPGWIKYYNEMHKGYPHPDTADQFFDEEQLEAQRMVGEESVHDAFGDLLLNAIAVDSSPEVKQTREKIHADIKKETTATTKALNTIEKINIRKTLVDSEASAKIEEIEKEEAKEQPKDEVKIESHEVYTGEGLNFFSLYDSCPFSEENLNVLYSQSIPTESISDTKKTEQDPAE
jgi:hypothetical protein